MHVQGGGTGLQEKRPWLLLPLTPWSTSGTSETMERQLLIEVGHWSLQSSSWKEHLPEVLTVGVGVDHSLPSFAELLRVSLLADHTARSSPGSLCKWPEWTPMMWDLGFSQKLLSPNISPICQLRSENLLPESDDAFHCPLRNQVANRSLNAGWARESCGGCVFLLTVA